MGSVWADRHRSAVPAALAAAAELVLRGSTAPGGRAGDGLVAAWTLRSAERLFGADASGRQAYGYPAPAAVPEPGAVGLSSASGPLWLPGLDYYTAAGRVWFYADPLAQAAAAAKLEPDPVSGGRAVVWAVAADPGAPAPRRTGGSYDALTAALAVAYDAPRFESDGVVEALVELDDGRWMIATDAEAFVLPAGSPAAGLEVGAAVAAGDPAGTAWRLVRLGMPVAENLALGADALPEGVAGPLVWPDQVVAVTADVVGGRTRARFPLGGAGADVTAFWAAAHDQALAGKVSVAELLDTRVSPFGEPTPYDVAGTVNPAEFLARVVVGGAGYLVDATPAAYGPAALAAADRKALLADAAGTGCGVFEFEGGVPNLPAVLP
jgi:hypothetical protein